MVPNLPGSGPPPFWLDVRPGGHLVIGLAAAALILGAAGLFTGLYASRLPARALLVTGCAVAALLAFLPSFGSADHLNYAAYGRMVTLGLDPYVTVPADLPGDPVLGSVEEWTTTPSVYGPVATAVQAFASWIGGDSVRLTVFVLAVVNAAAFVATALLLHRATSQDPVRQGRAALLWTANPLVVYQLAAGMHVDTLAIAFMIAALVFRGRWVACGVLLGLGVAVKITAGLVALGPAWEARRQLSRLAVVAGIAVAVAGVAYWLAGPHAFDQVLNASRSVSLATPWKLVQRGLQLGLGSGAYRVWIQLGSLILLAVLVWGLSRRFLSLDGRRFLSLDGRRSLSLDGRRSLPLDGPMVAVVFVVAWLFATPYVLPWYDGLAFALLALVPASALDGFLVVRLAALSLAYLPARQLGQPGDLGWLVDVVRAQVVPATLLGLTGALLWWTWRGAGRAARRPGSAAPLPSTPSPGSRSPSR